MGGKCKAKRAGGWRGVLGGCSRDGGEEVEKTSVFRVGNGVFLKVPKLSEVSQVAESRNPVFGV